MVMAGFITAPTNGGVSGGEGGLRLRGASQ